MFNIHTHTHIGTMKPLSNDTHSFELMIFHRYFLSIDEQNDEFKCHIRISLCCAVYCVLLSLHLELLLENRFSHLDIDNARS